MQYVVATKYEKIPPPAVTGGVLFSYPLYLFQ